MCNVYGKTCSLGKKCQQIGEEWFAIKTVHVKMHSQVKEKFWGDRLVKKVMLTVFWGRKRSIPTDFLEKKSDWKVFSISNSFGKTYPISWLSLVLFLFHSLCIFHTRTTGSLSLQSEWKQVFSGFEDFAQYLKWSQQCWGLYGLDSSYNFQFLGDHSNRTNNN